MKPRLGLIARADNGGLGVQTWEFYRHLQPAKTLVIDISNLTTYQNHFERYPQCRISYGEPVNEVMDDFLNGLDVVLTAETPYNFELFQRARDKNVKTALQYNFEFLEYFRHPDWPRPDLFIAPSTWRYNEVPFPNKVLLPVPVDRERLPFRQRDKAMKFLHIAGHESLTDRNGTELVLAALPLIQTPVRVVIRSQRRRPFEAPPAPNVVVEVANGDITDYWDVFSDEDVLLLPRRFGGLSLQLDQALSLGMVPIMTDIAPQNSFLAPESLIPAHCSGSTFAAVAVDVFSAHPHDLAAKIDELANSPSLVSKLSTHSDDLADALDWRQLGPVYESTLESLL